MQYKSKLKKNAQAYVGRHKLSTRSAGVAIRQDGVPVWLHGPGHPAAQRPALDPGRRVHRQVLHGVRHGQPAAGFRALRLAAYLPTASSTLLASISLTSPSLFVDIRNQLIITSYSY